MTVEAARNRFQAGHSTADDVRLALGVVDAVGEFLRVSQGGTRTGVNFKEWSRAKGQLRDAFAAFQSGT